MTTMKRWVLKANRGKGTGGLVLEDAPTPVPGPGEVRIRIHAVSLNYRDQLILNREYGVELSEDLVPVADGAGEIDAAGPGVERWHVGDRVVGRYFRDWIAGPPPPASGWGLGSPGDPGMLSQYVVLPTTRIARMPRSMDFASASTLPCAATTAWTALFEKNPVSIGQDVLVLGTGGVSLFALLLARAAGARVVATTSQDAKAARLLELGASDVVNYRTTPNWGQAAFERTGRGFDKVVNAAGGGAMDESIAALAPGGEIALMGLFSFADKPPVWPVLMAKSASVRGTAVGGAMAFDALVAAVDAHRIKAPISRRFAFGEAVEAYRAQVAPELFGKIVIDVSEP